MQALCHQMCHERLFVFEVKLLVQQKGPKFNNDIIIKIFGDQETSNVMAVAAIPRNQIQFIVLEFV